MVPCRPLEAPRKPKFEKYANERRSPSGLVAGGSHGLRRRRRQASWVTLSKLVRPRAQDGNVARRRGAEQWDRVLQRLEAGATGGRNEWRPERVEAGARDIGDQGTTCCLTTHWAIDARGDPQHG